MKEELILFFSDINFILIFLLFFIPIYAYVPSNVKRFVLLIGGLLFYGLNDILTLPVIIADILIAFFVAKAMDHYIDKPRLRSSLLWGVITLQIILMCAPLFIRGHIFIGVGFFTVMFIGYYSDVYRGNHPAATDFVTFANYIMFFPKILQGPITSYMDMEKSLKEPEQINPAKLEKGLRIFILGMSYKIILADPLASLWNGVQTIGFQSVSTVLAWISMYSYSIQLYLDFQGYSLMAVGVAFMLGYELPQNFNSPYMSRSISEFYRRWHMTLGEWFKKYVYFPLGGSRNGRFKTILSLSAVWILTGLWHGFTLNYMIWAGMLLLFIILEKTLFAKIVKSKNWFAKLIGHVFVIFYIPLTWMAFAISDPERIMIFYTRLYDLQNIFRPINVNSLDYVSYVKDYWPFLLGGFICCFPVMETFLVKTRVKMTRFISFALFWVCIYLIMKNGNNPFMYLNF